MTMRERCVYVCGPYKGYCGRAEFEDNVFQGEVLGTRDVITFQGGTPKEVRQAFRDSVDDYLDFCRADNAVPEKPFSGRFVARLDPELHRTISNMANAVGKSLNQFICECLNEVANRGIPATVLKDVSPQRTTKSKKIGSRKGQGSQDARR